MKQLSTKEGHKIFDPREIKTVSDAKAYSRGLQPNLIFQNFNYKLEQFATVKRNPRTVEKTQKYIMSHHERTFGGKFISSG